MLSLPEIRSNYPEQFHGRGEFLLREYLQYKILEILFKSKYASKFAFLGGTCLRIVHQNNRFSEDLDFDNFDLSVGDFEAVSQIISRELKQQGYKVEMRNVLKGAYHCYIRFPGILYETGLSGHKEAKILINLDTQSQGFQFKPIISYLQKFDVLVQIYSTPLDLLLSQKIVAITKRRRPKGRDFFDTIFLIGKTKPNYNFLDFKLNISTPDDLKEHLLKECQKIDFQKIAADVQPFLFNPREIDRVLIFPDFIKTISF